MFGYFSLSLSYVSSANKLILFSRAVGVEWRRFVVTSKALIPIYIAERDLKAREHMLNMDKLTQSNFIIAIPFRKHNMITSNQPFTCF